MPFDEETVIDFDPDHQDGDGCGCPMCLINGGNNTDGEGNGGEGNNPGNGGNNIDTGGPTANPTLPISTNNLPNGAFDNFFGSNPPAANSAGPLAPRNVITFYQGDRVALGKSIPTINGVVATPANSDLRFTLVDERFFGEALWVGTWADGIEPTNNAGGILIEVPHELTSRLRRGAYLYSLSLSDKIATNTRETFEEGTICIEYSANAPLPNVPYRNPSPESNNTQNNP